MSANGTAQPVVDWGARQNFRRLVETFVFLIALLTKLLIVRK